jgi:hypothetical protein
LAIKTWRTRESSDRRGAGLLIVDIFFMRSFGTEETASGKPGNRSALRKKMFTLGKIVAQD